MPITELPESIKARLWDLKYTPFLGSFLISWFLWNYKIILIYFSNINDIDKKIVLLEQYISWTNYAAPFTAAIIYTLAYPLLSNTLYKVTLIHKNNAHEIKRDAVDDQIVTQQQKKDILK